MPTPGVRTAPDEAKLGNGFEFVYTLGYEACSIPVLGLDSHELRGDSHMTHESVLFPNCKDILNILDRKVTALQGRDSRVHRSLAWPRQSRPWLPLLAEENDEAV